MISHISALEVTVKVGIAGELIVTVGVTAELIAIETAGLLGNINNDPTDDLLTPRGEVLSNETNEESIYSNFGLKCKIKLHSILIHITSTAIYIYCIDTCYTITNKHVIHIVQGWLIQKTLQPLCSSMLMVEVLQIMQLQTDTYQRLPHLKG